MAHQTPHTLYTHAVGQGLYTHDTAQVAAIDVLDNLRRRLRWPWLRPRGVYVYGGVGRGKSMVMDMFFAALPKGIAKQRTHFHAFMQNFHADLHLRRAAIGTTHDLLPNAARAIARKIRVLCFDEFLVDNVADALILSRLFTALFKGGVRIVITSNTAPQDLYMGGLQRDLFLPFIALLEREMDLISLDGSQDYRLIEATRGAYFLGRTPLKILFARQGPAWEETLYIGGRSLPLRVAGDGKVAWGTFATLCEQPRGAADYLELVQRYEGIFLDGVPRFGYDRRNEAARFTTLVDVVYDSGVRFAVSAAVPIEELHVQARTASRLVELSHRGWD